MPTSDTNNASYATQTQFAPIKIDSFKAYDIRGELGVNLDEEIAYRIGRAFAQILFERYSSADNDATACLLYTSPSPRD